MKLMVWNLSLAVNFSSIFLCSLYLTLLTVYSRRDIVINDISNEFL